MFRDTIDGLNNIFDTDVHQGAVIIITGPPGCLKSGFSYNIISKYLENRDEFGVYMTLEESTESHLRNMKSLGISIPDNLLISDYSDIRSRFEGPEDEHPDFLEMIDGVVNFFIEKEGERFTSFCLDSLGALYSLTPTEGLRAKMFYFFKGLRERNLTSLIVMETPRISNIQGFLGSEWYLADGIIEMGSIETQHDIMLYMQVQKMRATSHSRKKHLIEIGEDGLSILGPVFE
jgi:KaiC/GvpD/RAD55 family RecA-like ATPase